MWLKLSLYINTYSIVIYVIEIAIGFLFLNVDGKIIGE